MNVKRNGASRVTACQEERRRPRGCSRPDHSTSVKVNVALSATRLLPNLNANKPQTIQTLTETARNSNRPQMRWTATQTNLGQNAHQPKLTSTQTDLDSSRPRPKRTFGPQPKRTSTHLYTDRHRPRRKPTSNQADLDSKKTSFGIDAKQSGPQPKGTSIQTELDRNGIQPFPTLSQTNPNSKRPQVITKELSQQKTLTVTTIHKYIKFQKHFYHTSAEILTFYIGLAAWLAGRLAGCFLELNA